MCNKTHGNPTITDMSSECKAMIINKVYEHYTMNITWREILQKFSAVCIFLFPILSLLTSGNRALQTTIIILSTLISILVIFFCDTKDYYLKLHEIKELYAKDCKDDDYSKRFNELLPLIRPIDISRGRYDYTQYCKECKIEPTPYDRYTEHDIGEMNRQRLIILCLCIIACSLCGLILGFVKNIDTITTVILIFIIIATAAGFILMAFDCISQIVNYKKDLKSRKKRNEEAQENETKTP